MLKDGGAVGADAVDVDVDADGDVAVEAIGGNGTLSPTGIRARLRPDSQPNQRRPPLVGGLFFCLYRCGQ